MCVCVCTYVRVCIWVIPFRRDERGGGGGGGGDSLFNGFFFLNTRESVSKYRQSIVPSFTDLGDGPGEAGPLSGSPGDGAARAGLRRAALERGHGLGHAAGQGELLAELHVRAALGYGWGFFCCCCWLGWGGEEGKTER